MALVSGGRSTLNPNAPLFVPAAVRQVEDFSPEWWNLVTTSTWFHDYWLSQHQEEDIFDGNNNDDFDGNDLADLLPDTFDFGTGEDLSSMEAQFEEFIQSSETEGTEFFFGSSKGMPENGLVVDTEAFMKNLSLPKSPKENGGVKYPAGPAKYQDKPARCMSQKCSPRRIQQPR